MQAPTTTGEHDEVIKVQTAGDDSVQGSAGESSGEASTATTSTSGPSGSLKRHHSESILEDEGAGTGTPALSTGAAAGPGISALVGSGGSYANSSAEREGSPYKRAMSEDVLEQRTSSGAGDSAVQEMAVDPLVVAQDVEKEEATKDTDIDMEDLPVRPAEEPRRVVPSAGEQVRIIGESAGIPLAPKQTWYILPAAWLRELRRRAADDLPTTDLGAPDCRPLINQTLYERHATTADSADANPPTSPSVGPDGEGLFYGSEPAQGEVHLGGSRIRDGLLQGDGSDADMLFVTDAVWRKIVAWYGEVSPAGGLLRRTQSDSQGNVVIEVNPPTFLVHVVGDGRDEVPLRVTGSKYENLSDLHKLVRLAVLGGKSAPSRLWKLEMPPALLVEAEAATTVVVQDAQDKEAREVEGAAVVRGLPGSAGTAEQPDAPQPMDISTEELPGYDAPPGYTGPTATSAESKPPLPSRYVPARRLPSISAALLNTLGPGSRVADDPLVEEALLDSGDCLALEIGQQPHATAVRWEVDVNEENRAQEKAVARPPLFSKPGLFSGSSNCAVLTIGTQAATNGVKDGIVTRSQSAGPSKGKTRGLRGLQNLGNTCFMNSALQCLSNTKELSEYFQSDEYQNEVNRDNPLGMHGKIALVFGKLIKDIWDANAQGNSHSFYSQGNAVVPREFKATIGRFAPSFAGYGQQDSQELIAFLLDGLHEDLNRIYKKPYIEKPDWKDGGTDEDLALMGKECWEGYQKRNDSIIVDLFQGQLKSTLVCPDCNKKSITLDPFMYLTVPIPTTKTFEREVFFVPLDKSQPKRKILLSLSMTATFSNIKQKVAKIVGCDASRLIAIDEHKSQIYAYFSDDDMVSSGSAMSDVIVLHEVAATVQQSHSASVTKGDRLVVPVYHFQRTSMGGVHQLAHPSFVAIDTTQQNQISAILEAIALNNTAWVREDKDSALFEEAPPVEGAPPTDEQAPTAVTSPSKRRPAKKIYDVEIMVNRHNYLGSSSRRPELWHGNGESRTTLVERLKAGGNVGLIGTAHRAVNGLGGMMGLSNPPSDNEDEEPKVKRFLRADEGLAVIWPVEQVREFFGPDLKGNNEWQSMEDPELVAARAKSTRRNTIDIEDCLAEFSRPEVLGEQDLWYCSSCKAHKAATKTMEIYQVPDILVICIKRFSGTGYRNNKVNDTVSFPVNGLNLEERCDERRIAKALYQQGKNLEEYGLERALEPLEYDLYAVDNHFGGLGGGHYTSTCKNFEDGKWYNYDDSRVTPASEQDISGSAAYLLFYRKRTTRAIGGRFREKVEAALSSRGVSPAPSISRMPVDHPVGKSALAEQVISAPLSPAMSEQDELSDSPVYPDPLAMRGRRHMPARSESSVRTVSSVESPPEDEGV